MQLIENYLTLPTFLSRSALSPSPSFCIRWSSRPWTRRATPTCRGLWSRVRRPREESTPSTRPLFSNIHPPCPLLCVCAFQRLPCTGAPPRSWARATHAAASPHRLKNKKTKHPAPPPLAEPVHCMMTFGVALSLYSFSLSLLSLLFLLSPSLALATSSCLQGWRMTFEPRAVVHFSVSTCRGNGQIRFSTSCLSVSLQSISRLFCFQLLVFLFFFSSLLMGATIWLRLSPPASIPPFISAPLSNCP